MDEGHNQVGSQEFLKEISRELSRLNKKIDKLKEEEAVEVIASLQEINNTIIDVGNVITDGANVGSSHIQNLSDKISRIDVSGSEWRAADYAILLVLLVIAWRVW